MKDSSTKLPIYQGIIQYLLESTDCDLKNIAELSNSTVDQIYSIHLMNKMPDNFSSESQLLKLYQIILDVHLSIPLAK